jgi:hypothetical protein
MGLAALLRQDGLASTTTHIKYCFPNLGRKRLDCTEPQRRQLDVQ